EILEPLRDSEVEELIEKLLRANCESIAISLLFSFLHPQHEKKIAKALAKLDVPLSVSSQILPEYREYERTSTVAVNAYLQPLMGRYLSRLSKTRTSLKPQASIFASCNRLAAASRQKLRRMNRCARSSPVPPVALSARCAHHAQPAYRRSSRSTWAAHRPTSRCAIAKECA